MLCSKCKIFSIHLPNFDSYICEFGHVFCRSCLPKPQSRCSICNGRIVRRAELLIEGVPKTILRQTPNEDCNHMSDGDSEMKFHINSDSDENWSRIFDYGDSESSQDYPENNYRSPRRYDCEIPTPKINIIRGDCDFPRKIPSNHDTPGEFTGDLLKPRRSASQFRAPSNENNKLEDINYTQDNPKNTYRKTSCGFDPKKDYNERVAHVNTIHEYYKRPNLSMATKSSPKVEIKMDDANLTDSSTVIQHLTEFRKATNYLPPSNVNTYIVSNGGIMSEPAIINTSKTEIPPRKGPRAVSPPTKQQPTTNTSKELEATTLYSDSTKAGTNKGLKRVDVGTMMDICMSPSVTIAETPNKELEFNLKLPSRPTKEHSKEQSEQLSSLLNTEAIRQVEYPEKVVSDSLPTFLREQLRNQVYSQFECEPKKPQNAFMVKGNYGPNDALPPRSIQVTAFPKAGKLSEAINSEVEKALKNLTSFPKLQFNASQRRDEIVKQSKNLLRQRIMDEVYSRFEKSQPVQHAVNEEAGFSAQQLQITVQGRNRKEKLEEEPDVKLKGSGINVIRNTNQTVEINTNSKVNLSMVSMNLQEKRSVGMSTESYPKLNPDLNVILPSKDSTQKSYSLSSPVEFTRVPNYSFRKESNMQPTSCISSNGENDVVDEILQQFQRNVSIASGQNIFDIEPPQDMEAADFETVLRIDRLSPNNIYDPRETQPFADINPDINVHKPKANDNQIFMPSEVHPDHPAMEQIQQNVYFFQQHPHYTTPTAVAPPSPLITAIGNDCANVTMETMARSLVNDFREEPKNGHANGVLDINKFIQYIKYKFPNISLKQLKDIIFNIPTDESEAKELNEIGTRFPPVASFRSDYDKFGTGLESSEKQLTEQTTMGLASSDYPIEFPFATMITAWRAYFCPPIDLYAEPIPQLKPVSRFATEASIIDRNPRQVKAAAELNLSRNPIICPVTTCNKLIFVSEFSKHIKMDHVKIPVETLVPGRSKNLFLDPRIDEYGMNKCHILYLVTEKIRDLGSKEFKDYLPLLVMATRVNLLQLISPLYNPRSEEVPSIQQSYLMIWLTGLSPQDLPIYFSITAWHRYSTTPKCHIVHSGRIYSIRNKQDDRSVYNSGNAMLLSQNQIQLLTNNGQDMMELQVIVH